MRRTAIRSACSGRMTRRAGPVVRAFLPGAEAVDVLRRSRSCAHGPARRGRQRPVPGDRQRARRPISCASPGRAPCRRPRTPIRFGPVLGDIDLHLFNEGRHFELAQALGANVMTIDGVSGTRFAVWAPNAGRVAVVGDFNAWDARRHPMRLRHGAGIWELFVPARQRRRALQVRYRRRRRHPRHRKRPIRSRSKPNCRRRPPRSSRARSHSAGAMPNGCARAPRATRPMRRSRSMRCISHPGCGPRMMRAPPTLWDVAIDRLIPYLADMGFTHVELLPITEHPFGGSWGYQPLSLFAPSARYGTPDGFARFVDALHAAGIGIILDWVPAHFPTDAHGLARFDGTALYEHLDPREGFHQDWNTLHLQFRAARGAGLPDRQRAALARAFPRRRAARRCGRLDALPRLQPQRRRMGAERPWRTREPRGRRLPAPSQRSGAPSAVRAR